jgi:hypothetical protein
LEKVMIVHEMRSRRQFRATLAAIMILGVFAVCKGVARAQTDIPPGDGGLTYELGMPPVYKGRAGLESGWYRPQSASEPFGFFSLGVAKSLGSPVVGIAGLRLEGYVGMTHKKIDGGGRALFEIPSFHVGFGTDFNASDSVTDFLFALDLPLRRGGLFGRGTTLALRWLPTRDQTFSVGVNVPLWGRNIGATRPKRDHFGLIERKPLRLEQDLGRSELAVTLDELAERAQWVARLTQPFAEHAGADPHAAMAPVLAELTDHIAAVDADFPGGHTLPAEIRAFHATLDQAFTLATGGNPEQGAAISARAREFLLDDVLIPYNRLLGQRKTNDSLIGMIAVAKTNFGGWVLSTQAMGRDSVRRVFYVFKSLCDLAERTRAELRERWEDSRLVWLPLEFALTPEQHDSQGEIDALVARATGQEFTHENRVWYVINEEFQWEMARSVRQAEDYHVLWIHDFRGKNGDGDPDAIAYAHTLNYLEALIERVRAYDKTNTMPQYFVLLDQHYFEINKGRIWLRLLREPLDYELSLPADRADWEARIREAQDRLRTAVAESRLLQLGTSQYGEKWLKNLVKVHVNITNPADPSFFSWHVAGILPIPDNMMRDHRKIAFYDVTEADPYRGLAMFTGMGIGEHYVGPGWEDRAIMVQGPGALAVKDAARGLLEAQGFTPEEIPYTLRRRAKPEDYGRMLAAEHAGRTPDWLDDRGGVIQLHNETGFHYKPINVAKAVLYSLMPPGSVLEVPDSLWQSYIYASLLGGSALRGCRVAVIAPTAESAPSAAPPTLARAHGLMGRIIAFSSGMHEQIEAQGGLMKVGLYAPRQGVGDIAGRMRQAVNSRPPWAQRIFPDNPALTAAVGNVDAILDSLGYEVRYLNGSEADVVPKIHLKANFIASETAWLRLHERPELAEVLRQHVAYLARQAGGDDGDGRRPNVRQVPEELAAAWTELVAGLVRDLSPAEREELAYYFTVGSANMDYRSMVMDGEAMVVLGGWQALYGYLDFLLLPGLCEWVETTEQLDTLLPPPSGMIRRLAGLMKLSL